MLTGFTTSISTPFALLCYAASILMNIFLTYKQLTAFLTHRDVDILVYFSENGSEGIAWGHREVMVQNIVAL